jgi:hypothetical protein
VRRGACLRTVRKHDPNRGLVVMVMSVMAPSMPMTAVMTVVTTIIIVELGRFLHAVVIRRKHLAIRLDAKPHAPWDKERIAVPNGIATTQRSKRSTRQAQDAAVEACDASSVERQDENGGP